MHQQIISKLCYYAQLMRWHRPIGIFLLLWPTWWALWLAGAGQPDPKLILIFTLGVWVMRSAGCVINDYADRHIDNKVQRTRDRPLTSGKVTVTETWILFGILCLVAFLLVLQLNWFTIKLSVIGLLLASIYPFTKRYTHWPQIVLGLAFSWAIIMAFAAQTNSVPAIAWILFAANTVWTTAYDTQYAMADRPDDLKIGVKSTAILFGHYDRIIIGLLQLVVLLALIIVGLLTHLTYWYYLGLLVAAGLAGYQQFLIKDRIPQNCFQAFLNNNWFGTVVFMGLLWHFAYQT